MSVFGTCARCGGDPVLYWFCKTCCPSFYDALFPAKEKKVITQAMLDAEYAAVQTLQFPAKGVSALAKAKKKSGKKKGAGSKMSGGTKTGKY